MEFNLIVFTAEKIEAYIAIIKKRDHFAYGPDLNSVSIFGNYSLIKDSLVPVTAGSSSPSCMFASQKEEQFFTF